MRRVVRWFQYLITETLISISDWSTLLSFLISFFTSVGVVIFVLGFYTLSGKIEEISNWHVIGIMFGCVYIPIQSTVFRDVVYEWSNGILAQKWMSGISRFTIILTDNIVDSIIFILLLIILSLFCIGMSPSQVSIYNVISGIIIVVPTIIATTRLYAILLTKDNVSSLLGFVALVPSLPSLSMSANVISNKYIVWHDIGIGIAYCMFCIIGYSLVSWLISMYIEITV